MRKIWIAAGVLAALAVMAAVAVPPLVRSHVRAHVKVEPEGLAVAPQKGSMLVSVNLRVRNDAGIDARLMAARYTVDLAGGEIGAGTFEPGPDGVLVATGSEAVLPLSLEVDPARLLGSAFGIFRGAAADLTVKGTLDLKVLGWPLTVPFERKPEPRGSRRRFGEPAS